MNVRSQSVYIKWSLLLLISTIAVYWLTPIYLGVFFAFTLTPIMQQRQHQRFPKMGLLLYGIGIGTVVALVTLLLYQSAEKFLPKVHVFIDYLLNHATFFFSSSSLQMMAEEMVTMETILASFTHSSSILMDFLLFLLIFFSASFQFYRQPDWYLTLVPFEKRYRYKQTIQRVQSMSALFFRNELILFAFTWSATALFAWLLHIPQPFFIGFLVALADLIPFIGISLFYIPFSLYGYLTDQWMIATITLIMFVFVVISRQLLEPLLWKQSIRIPTFLLLISLTSLVVILGVKGLLLLPLLFIALSELNIKNA
ncbi:AI-2E family transporter [Chryseomicrobium palamuruense]|uniref:AI-2E family transporter n=1 Tax=Chryseomicrobium palamuruense TaxID=682973 RepID=A0ABV8UX60_9BACL